MKNTVQETSLVAYKELKKEDLREIYGKIIFALKNIKSGNSQMIAAAIGKKDEVVRKRLSEMQSMGIIFKPGHKLPMQSGKMGFVWQLVEGPENKPQIENKPLPGLSIQQYCENIDKIRKSSLF